MPQGLLIDVPDEDILDTNEAPRPKARAANDAGFSDLKDQLEAATKEKNAERKRADDAQRDRDNAAADARRASAEAATAREDARTARTESVEGRKIALTNAAASKKTILDSIESDYAAAMEAGDFKKSASLQRRMAEEAAELKTIEAGMAAMDDEPAPRKTAEGRVDRKDGDKPAKTGDPFDDYVAQFSPAVQTWLRGHPECVTNRTKNSQVIAAHNEATDKGYAPESDAYFAYIERKMGYKEDAARRAVAADNPTDDDDPPPQDTGRNIQQRDAPMRTSAAPSRGNGSGGSTSKVSLTPGEVLAAEDGTITWNVGNSDGRGGRIAADDQRVGQPIGVHEMARRKKAMSREGRYAVPSME